MIFLSIKPGLYQIQEDEKVIAYVLKKYNDRNWHVGYMVQFKDGKSEFYKYIYKIHEKYKFQNYPGYNKVLAKPK